MEQGGMACAAEVRRRYPREEGGKRKKKRREKEKERVRSGREIRHIRGLLKSGPRCLSIIRLVDEERYMPPRRDSLCIGYLLRRQRRQASKTRYLRLIGNGASLSFGISFPRENYHLL